MIVSAAHAHGVLFKNAHVGSRLTGIQQFGLASFQKFCDRTGIGRYTAHALQIIERHPFARKQNADIARQLREELSLFHLVAVGDEKFRLRRFVEQTEGAQKHAQAADYAVLFAEKLYLALSVFGHNRIGGNVLAGDVLFQRHFNEFIRL